MNLRKILLNKFQIIALAIVFVAGIGVGCKKDEVKDNNNNNNQTKTFVSAKIGGTDFYTETVVPTITADTLTPSLITATSLTGGVISVIWNGGSKKAGTFEMNSVMGVPLVGLNYKTIVPSDPQYKTGTSESKCTIVISSIKDGFIDGTFSGVLVRIKDNKEETIEIKDGKLNHIPIK